MLIDGAKFTATGNQLNSGVELVTSLPATGNFEGREVALTQTDGDNGAGIYTYINGAWVGSADSAKITALVNSLITNKADKGTSLTAYGIGDAYSKTEVNTLLENFTPVASYSKIEVDGMFTNLVGLAPTTLDTIHELAAQMQADESGAAALVTTVGGKADKGTTLTAYGITDAYTKSEVNSAIASAVPTVTFANLSGKPTTVVGYGITDAYTKTEVQAFFTGLDQNTFGNAIRSYIDDGDASTAAGVAAQITAANADLLQTALNYSTVAGNNASTGAKAYAVSQDALTLAAAKSYADTHSVALAAAQAATAAGLADNVILAQAKTYADSINLVATNEKNYVDSSVATAVSTLRGEANTIATTAAQNLSDAHTALDTRIDSLTTSAALSLSNADYNIRYDLNSRMNHMDADIRTYADDKVAASYTTTMQNVTDYLAARVPTSNEVLAYVDQQVAASIVTTENADNAYTDTKVAALHTVVGTETAASVLASLNTAKAYADSNLALANQHADDNLNRVFAGGFAQYATDQLTATQTASVAAAKTYTDTRETAITTAYTNLVASTANGISTAYHYADGELSKDIAKCLVDAKDYVDTQTLGSVRKTYVDSNDTRVLSSAHAYTDTQLVTTESNLQLYAESQASTAQQAATDYADTVAANTLNAAKAYADSSVVSSITSYVDSTVATAKTAANTHSDAAVAALAQTIADAGYQNATQVASAITAAAYSLPTASNSVLGGVKVDGTTITISNGVISSAASYNLPTASTSTLGGVKIDGTTISIDGNGVISAAATSLSIASTSTLGGIKVGAGLAINAATGVLTTDVTVQPYDFASNLAGKPTAGATVMMAVAPRNCTLPANFASSFAKSLAAATATATFSINKNGTQIATFAFAASSTSATFSTQSALSIAAGDIITVTSPATQDATLSDLSWTFAAFLA
jgi:hypothetical protein